MRILVIGGSRFVGPLLVSRLAGRGHSVTVFNRGRIAASYPEGVEHVKGDRDEGFSFKGDFDAVIDMCAYEPGATRKALDSLNYGFFVHMGTAAAYARSEAFPLTEASPLGEWPLWGEYNRGKVGCEEALAESGASHAVLRPVYILGPNNYVDRERFIYSKLLHGRELAVPGNGQALVQFVFADEVAESLAMLAERRAEGAYNCCGDDFVTLTGLVRMMADICHAKPRIRFEPEADGDRFRESEFPFANENLICSNSRLRSLGMGFRRLRDGLEQDYRSNYSAISGGI